MVKPQQTTTYSLMELINEKSTYDKNIPCKKNLQSNVYKLKTTNTRVKAEAQVPGLEGVLEKNGLRIKGEKKKKKISRTKQEFIKRSKYFKYLNNPTSTEYVLKYNPMFLDNNVEQPKEFSSFRTNPGYWCSKEKLTLYTKVESKKTVEQSERDYIEQALSSCFEEKLFEFIKNLYKAQKKAYKKDKIKYRKRIILGVKETLKYARSNKLLGVIIPSNIQSGEILRKQVDQIKTTCKELEEKTKNLYKQIKVPFLYGLTRKKIGKALRVPSFVSCIGILFLGEQNADFKEIVKQSLVLKQAYEDMKNMNSRIICSGCRHTPRLSFYICSLSVCKNIFCSQYKILYKQNFVPCKLSGCETNPYQINIPSKPLNKDTLFAEDLPKPVWKRLAEFQITNED
eukprot:snap_masked-scaffold_32-processed-gene-3.23-mRNA-1 protein AED:1.00 eAED:1.00 QI:0/0/0/0/1/1/2/0/397